MAKVPKGRTASGVAAIAVGQHMNCQLSRVLCQGDLPSVLRSRCFQSRTAASARLKDVHALNLKLVTVAACHVASIISMRVSSGVCSIAKAWPWANQDASFSTNRCFGVFDGVSAAPQSREYAQLLASSTRAQLMQAQRDGFGAEPWPGQAQAVLRRAAAAAKGLNGAATSCMIRLDGDKGRLAVYNLRWGICWNC